jgi:hypothetical protein
MSHVKDLSHWNAWRDTARWRGRTDRFRARLAEVRVAALHDKTQLVLSLAAAALGLWTFTIMIVIVMRMYSPLPWGDYWDHYRLMLSDGYSLKTLLAQNNEHRIVLPRIWFWIDGAWFGSSGRFLYISIIAIQLSHALLLWRIGSQAARSSFLSSLFLGFILLTIAFSSQQLTNFTWTFEIQFVGVYLLATAALYSLSNCLQPAQDDGTRPVGSNRWLSLAVALSWAASYTMANGLLVWMALVLLALALDFPKGYIRIIAGNGILAWILYLVGYMQPLAHVPPQTALIKMPEAVAFACTYLGSPVDDLVSAINRIFGFNSEHVRPVLAASVGLAGMIYIVRLLLQLVEAKPSSNRVQTVLVLNMGFIALTAVVTGIGRGAQFRLVDALQSRYTTPALIFWACALILYWARKAKENAPDPLLDSLKPASNVQLAVLITIFFMIVIHQTPRLEEARGAKSYVGQSEAAVAARVFDEEAWKRLYYNPRALIPVVENMYRQRVSIFQDVSDPWEGRNFNALFGDEQRLHQCEGAFDEAAFIADETWPGYRVGGWAWDPQAKQGPGRVVIVDEKGMIRGVAANVYQRGDVLQKLWYLTDPNIGWRGYMSAGDFTALNAFLISRDGKSACRIGSRDLEKSWDVVRATDIDKTISGPEIRIRGSWEPDGYYPTVGAPDVKDKIFGSWNGSDANTGVIEMGPFDLPKNSSVVALPLVTGPTTGALSIRILDADSGDVMFSSPPPVSVKWLVWRLRFLSRSEDTRAVLEVRDDGKDWGAWLAVGMPHLMKQ